VHGPGCPVCVIPVGRIDDAVWLALQPNVTLATFGDMLRVPGSKGSLLDARSRGADVRMVYSPLDALELARANPERTVVFFAIGFETTTPSTAVTLLAARAQGVKNFLVFCNHVTIGPPLRAILDAPELRLDGLIAPATSRRSLARGPTASSQANTTAGRDRRLRAARHPAVGPDARAPARRRSGRVENQYTRVVREDANRARPRWSSR